MVLYLQKKIIQVYIILLLCYTLFPITQQVSGDYIVTQDTKINELDSSLNVSRLFYQNVITDNSTIRYLTYLIGDEVLAEPNGFEIYPMSHIFKLELHGLSDEPIIENVTDDYVLPFHYEFRVDSIGRVHTVYVKENYTLFYSIRGVDGGWVEEQITNPTEWYAFDPAITLGSDDLPRIVYAVNYNDNADEYWNVTGTLSSGKSIHYQMLTNSSEWLIFDVGYNHNPNPSSFRGINLQDTKNPGIMVKDGFTHIGYYNRKAIAVEARSQFLRIPEDPTGFTSADFKEYTHERVYQTAVTASVLRRPSIFLTEEGGAMLAYGTLTHGGVVFSYIDDVARMPNKDIRGTDTEWDNMLVNEDRPREVTSVSGIQIDGSIYVAYALYDRTDQEKNIFTHDVYVVSVEPSRGRIEGTREIGRGRVTQTEKTSYFYPNLSMNEDNQLEVGVIWQNRTDDDNFGSYRIHIIEFKDIPLDEIDSIYGFIYASVFIGLIVFSWNKLINKIPEKEKEEEILPHMINLRDIITKD
ncbi:MAG: hypothetical protein OEZ01_01605 [Candidatus Heimdallarchaeota archaeon]|nr:hypothetical protein [Candidatus Heimdallarchaeota archaeon]MDH5644670.1 hypothetical protein [Candidatus Heimdallarchaeota archaeon]